jgi:hypothetical protein
MAFCVAVTLNVPCVLPAVSRPPEEIVPVPVPQVPANGCVVPSDILRVAENCNCRPATTEPGFGKTVIEEIVASDGVTVIGA